MTSNPAINLEFTLNKFYSITGLTVNVSTCDLAI